MINKLVIICIIAILLGWLLSCIGCSDRSAHWIKQDKKPDCKESTLLGGLPPCKKVEESPCD